MRIRPRCPVRAGLAFLSLVLFSPSLAAAQQQSFVLDPRKTTIALTLDAPLHAVHGTFRATRGNILFDPASGAASGSIVVDATSGDTGNSTRDHKMHKEVLESDRSEISFFNRSHHGNCGRRLHGTGRRKLSHSRRRPSDYLVRADRNPR